MPDQGAQLPSIRERFLLGTAIPQSNTEIVVGIGDVRLESNRAT